LRQIAELRARARKPEDLDVIAEKAGLSSLLINPHLAGPMDFTNLGLGKGVYMPVMISNRSGGRPSMFDLGPGETATVGALVSDEGITLRKVTRDKGPAKDMEVGSTYTETWMTLEGKPRVSLEMKVTSLDRKVGKLTAEGSGTMPLALRIPIRITCYFWSCCIVVTIKI
jgi:hypothetical protein